MLGCGVGGGEGRRDPGLGIGPEKGGSTDLQK